MDQGGPARPRAGRGAYGIDGGVIPFIGYAVILAVLAISEAGAIKHHRFGTASLTGAGLVAVAGSAAGYLYSTGRGKRSVWAGLLDELDLRGDEQVLDVGCGRGAVLMLAAHRVPDGRAVGVDLWRRRDQSGNSRAATEHNAEVEGVRGRVEVIDADARDLPFPAASFDLMVSSLTIHNIKNTEGRRQALHEAVRVLRPGGRLRIVDDRVGPYAAILRAAGCADITVQRLDWRTWFGIPGHHLTMISARKR
jgi:SAM-dependent methyltransferase